MPAKCHNKVFQVKETLMEKTMIWMKSYWILEKRLFSLLPQNISCSIFFHFFPVQTRRLAAFFESLNSSLPLSAPKLRMHSHVRSVCIFVKIPETGRMPKCWHFGVWPKSEIWEKNTEMHVALHGNFSGPVSATDPVKSRKDAARLVACTWKKIFWLGDADFLWVTS